MRILLFAFALWSSMYIELSSGNITVGWNFGDCQRGENKVAEFSCTDRCNITSANATFRNGGDITLIGKYGKKVSQKLTCKKKNCFCKGSTKNPGSAMCSKINGYGRDIGSKVYFLLKCKKTTEDLKIIVNGNIKPTPTIPTSKPTPTPKVCNCYGAGMTGNCSSSGECICKTGHIGVLCEECGFGWRPKWGGGCQRCNCSDEGMTGDCGDVWCFCDEGYRRKGNKCISCNCLGPGASRQCDFYGDCVCLHGYYRVEPNCIRCPKCDGEGMDGSCDIFGCSCIIGYHKNGDICVAEPPSACVCKDEGMTGKCDPIFGLCICDKGYYLKTLYECAECQCHGFGMTGECTGRKECKCKQGFSGENCDVFDLKL